MDSRGIDRIEELPVADTPEDVAVLYSWANLHGAKYRDFSASRREYRAQLRHRAAEQVREQELKAQAEAEAAAAAADAEARQAESIAMSEDTSQPDSSRQQALREAGRASRIASAERVEAARRAEAAAMAEAVARRAEREIAEANASARRQAARYSDSEIRQRESGVDAAYDVPGEISDPYVPAHAYEQVERTYGRPNGSLSESRGVADRMPQSPEPFVAPAAPVQYEAPGPQVVEQPSAPGQASLLSSALRRRQGYRPDDASGVRQIYRGPEYDEPQGEYVAAEPVRNFIPVASQPVTSSAQPMARGAGVEPVTNALQESPTVPQPAGAQSAGAQSTWPFSSSERFDADFDARMTTRREPAAGKPVQPPSFQAQRSGDALRGNELRGNELRGNELRGNELQRRNDSPRAGVPVSPRLGAQVSPAGAGEISRGRRGQDDLGYQPPPSYSEPARRTAPLAAKSASGSGMPYATDPTGPAWLYTPQTPATPIPAAPIPSIPTRSVAPAGSYSSSSASSPMVQSSVADTLQYSRERVAARWYALKGVFEQPGQDQSEAPIRQKETKTPMLAVFSLAGGVGKTSLVATLGRALSSLGEKVLLTDTTSHGLLPFYFGASELRQGVVRTFSPPSGSTDAPIYLVSYDVDQKGGDEAEDQLVEEIKNNSRGTHRVLLDLTPGSGWVARKLARINPTILVPLAPDMNSVISLQSVEKYFHGAVDSDGRPLQPYYVINQFDASLPLHLDVREVLRRQLSDRLLPFVIRRAPSVSEALAEGMTVVDYAPETPIAEDYQNVAAWLRTIAAPATAGFRNVRWSER
jgi:cellulose synthase operon protein YhjQ